jgi:hypothetical protein
MDRPLRQIHGQVRHPTQWLRDLALPVGFLLVAMLLWLSPRSAEIPVGSAASVEPAALLVQPRRSAMTDPPRIVVEGRSQNCNGCHQIFTSAHGGGERPNYHTEIQLSHGMNARCVNCHDPENRERLTLRDGSTVPYAETPMLCAQCHGTVFRDWQAGTHGKTLGSWVTGAAAQRRLTCNECHDPHAPRYMPMQPLPGPQTLRMGEAAAAQHEPPSRSPLRRWLAPSSRPHAADKTPDGDSP